MKRRLFILLLALTMVLGLAATASAEGEFITSGDWTYQIVGEKAWLCSYVGSDTEITVPAVIDGYSVETLGRGMGGSPFNAVKDTMTSVILEEGIERINNTAFRNCTALEWAYVPGTVTSIGSYAFQNCTSLYDVHLEEGVRSVGICCFLNTGLQTVFLPASLTSISDEAFGYVGEQMSPVQNKDFAIFGYSGTAAQTYAKSWHFTFYRLDDMEDFSGRCGNNAIWRFEASTGTLYIESTGKIDGECDTDAYYNHIQPWAGFADQITRVVVGEGITHLGDFAFALTHTNLTEVVLPSTLRGIGNGCFDGCTALTRIDLPEKVSFIGGHAFRGTGLTRIVLPHGSMYRSHLARAFDDCANLKAIIFTGGPWTITDDAFLNHTVTAWYPADDTEWTDSYMKQYGGNVTWKPYTPLPFTDVYPGTYCFDSVGWAVAGEITQGVTATEFQPDSACTRGQVVTFLWRAAGKPEPTVTEHPFTDVREGAYYYKAMLWAVENNITSGITKTTFAPNEPCTRGQVVTFLWRAKDKPAPTSMKHPFTDVAEGKYYYTAMLWAVENNITSGTGKATFAPNDPCTRGQVVTFLYRAYPEV